MEHAVSDETHFQLVRLLHPSPPSLLMNTQSVWQKTVEDAKNRYPSITQDLRVDALIVGGGITGVTAAYLLKKAGKKVALVEKNTVGSGETSHTTAHITYPTDERLRDLVSTFGRSHAQAAWDAQLAGSDQIASIVRSESIACELRHIPGYLFAAGEASIEDEGPRLMEDFQLSSEMGFDTSYVASAPVVNRPAVRFANQMKFHPLKYVNALAGLVNGDGSHVFEGCEASDFQESPSRAKCGDHTITYDHVFFATHVPLQGNTGTLSAALFQTKQALYSTYAIGAKLPAGSAPEALLWDTADPYLYLRFDRAEDGMYLIIGGKDHKTGQEENTAANYASLEADLLALFPDAAIDYRWSGQVVETPDGLPYIGEISKGQYVATGFSGTGMTWGTTAAMMFRDHVLGIKNPWQDLLAVSRKTLSASWDYVKENKDYPFYLAKDLVAGPAKEQLANLLCGEGKILRQNGKKVAASRSEDGNLLVRSAVCPHMGCIVAWNSAEKTWDCPCHGSRFTASGDVIGGPAESPLEEVGV